MRTTAPASLMAAGPNGWLVTCKLGFRKGGIFVREKTGICMKTPKCDYQRVAMGPTLYRALPHTTDPWKEGASESREG